MHIGEKKEHAVKISVMRYNEKEFEEFQAKSAEECARAVKGKDRVWINIDGVHDVELIDRIGKEFGISPLILEDIANTTQRPKVEDYGEYLYAVLQMFYYSADGKDIVSEQVSMILGKNYVISFQEEAGRDVFGPVRERIRDGKGPMRKNGADYLFYSLMDSIVDNYFVILEGIGDSIEELEEKLTVKPDQKVLRKIHELKVKVLLFRKAVWPLREVMTCLARGETALIRKGTTEYLRDVYDHVIEVIETVETHREMMTGMVDIYLSSTNNKMNEIMKVLTIIATIFIPLTFITGVYGMNFHFMPELEWELGYSFAWGMMAVVALVMIVYFKIKKWI
jgi:magnesium transporter